MRSQWRSLARPTLNAALPVPCAVAAKRLERLIARTKSGEYVSAINFARAYLRLGDKEQALRWLKTSCEERNVHSLTIGSDPFYDPLRTDRRFNKLLQRMKLRV